MNGQNELAPIISSNAQQQLKKIAVIGSRTFGNYDLLNSELSLLNESFILISGGAKGVDQMAEGYADAHGYSKVIYKPDYKSFGKNAPVVRNTEIVDAADLVIIFWDRKSKGTLDVLNKCKRKNKKYKLVLFKD
jgi:hypothetical protein